MFSKFDKAMIERASGIVKRAIRWITRVTGGGRGKRTQKNITAIVRIDLFHIVIYYYQMTLLKGYVVDNRQP